MVAIHLMRPRLPCQGFSTSNQRTRSSQNKNNWLFKEFVRVAKTVKPDWIVFENVKEILETEKGKFLKEISNSFSDLGYTITYGVLKEDHGISQLEMEKKAKPDHNQGFYNFAINLPNSSIAKFILLKIVQRPV